MRTSFFYLLIIVLIIVIVFLFFGKKKDYEIRTSQKDDLRTERKYIKGTLVSEDVYRGDCLISMTYSMASNEPRTLRAEEGGCLEKYFSPGYVTNYYSNESISSR